MSLRMAQLLCVEVHSVGAVLLEAMSPQAKYHTEDPTPLFASITEQRKPSFLRQWVIK